MLLILAVDLGGGRTPLHETTTAPDSRVTTQREYARAGEMDPLPQRRTEPAVTLLSHFEASTGGVTVFAQRCASEPSSHRLAVSPC